MSSPSPSTSPRYLPLKPPHEKGGTPSPLSGSSGNFESPWGFHNPRNLPSAASQPNCIPVAGPPKDMYCMRDPYPVQGPEKNPAQGPEKKRRNLTSGTFSEKDTELTKILQSFQQFPLNSKLEMGRIILDVVSGKLATLGEISAFFSRIESGETLDAKMFFDKVRHYGQRRKMGFEREHTASTKKILSYIHPKMTPAQVELFQALKNKSKEQVEAAMKKGADPVFAVACVPPTEVENAKDLLKEAGVNPADFNKKNWEGCTPLIQAAINKDIDLVRGLVRWGVPVDEKDNENQSTALMFAAQKGSLEIVQYLINDAHANVSARSSRPGGCYAPLTPLAFAAESARADVVTFLLTKDTDLSSMQMAYQYTYNIGIKNLIQAAINKQNPPPTAQGQRVKEEQASMQQRVHELLEKSKQVNQLHKAGYEIEDIANTVGLSKEQVEGIISKLMIQSEEKTQ